MYLGLTLWSPEQFINHRLMEALAYGISYGALLIMLIYNLFLIYSLRDWSYVFFTLFIGFAFLAQATYDGMVETYLWPAANVLKRFTLGGSVFGQMISLLLFTISFFGLRRRMPLLRYVLYFLIVAYLFLIVQMWFPSYQIGATLNSYFSIISYIVVILTSLIFLMRGFHPAGYFLISCFGLFFGDSMVYLSHLVVVKSSFFIEQSARIGLIWLVAFWALALADRINLLRAETENANAALRKSESRLSQILNGMPLGVALYTQDYKSKYINRKMVELLGDPAHNVWPDVNAGRTLSQAISTFSMMVAGSQGLYPLENLPPYRALHGEPARVDDLEIERGGARIPLEVWATPVKDEAGSVESAVVVVEDITQRKQVEAELSEHRKELEARVEQRTAELSATNQQLRRHIQWLAAINHISETLATSADLSIIYPMVIQIINQLFAIPASFIARWDPIRQELEILGHSYAAGPGHELVGSYISIPETLVSLSDLKQGDFVSISKDQFSSLNGALGEHLQALEVRSIVFTPLQVRDQTYGLLGLEICEDSRSISEGERDLLSILATDIAQLIEDEHLFEQAKILIATEERNRLARELHDSVAQTLYSISLFTDATRFALEADKLDVVGAHLQELVQLSREAMSDMRLLIFELRPPILEKDGFVAALQRRLDSVEARSGIQTTLYTEGELHLTSQQESELYWISLESLNNVIKHAEATQVKIELIGKDGYISLVIADNGIGFEPESVDKSGGQGIRNIRERSEHIGASSSIASARGQGTRITIELKNNEPKEEFNSKENPGAGK